MFLPEVPAPYIKRHRGLPLPLPLRDNLLRSQDPSCYTQPRFYSALKKIVKILPITVLHWQGSAQSQMTDAVLPICQALARLLQKTKKPSQTVSTQSTSEGTQKQKNKKETDTVPDFPTEELILQVADRRALWDHTDEKHADIYFTKKMWEEVGDSLIPNYEDLSPGIKKKFDEKMQKKWRSVRDAFKRYCGKVEKNVQKWIWSFKNHSVQI